MGMPCLLELIQFMLYFGSCNAEFLFSPVRVSLHANVMQIPSRPLTLSHEVALSCPPAGAGVCSKAVSCHPHYKGASSFLLAQ